MLAYAGPERRRFLDLRRAIHESPEPTKTTMKRIVRNLEPDLLQNMDSLCRELYTISDEAARKGK